MNKENTTPTTTEKEVVNQDQIRVFKSNNKKTERSPDFWGKLNIGEAEYEIAMWNNVSKAGNTYLSGFVSEAEDTDQAEVEDLF